MLTGLQTGRIRTTSNYWLHAQTIWCRYICSAQSQYVTEQRVGNWIAKAVKSLLIKLKPGPTSTQKQEVKILFCLLDKALQYLSVGVVKVS